MKTAPPRPRNALATRQLLFDTAERIFVAKGYDAARIDEIAAESGVNKRMIYVYFGDKERLYREVLRTNLSRVLALSDTALDASCDPRQQAESVVRAYFHFCLANPAFVRLMEWEALIDGRRVGQVLTDMASSGLENLHKAIERGVAAGDFRSGLDVRKFVFSVHVLCSSYVGRRQMLEELWKVDLADPVATHEVLEHILMVVFEGIVDRGKGTDGSKPRAGLGQRAQGGRTRVQGGNS